MTAVLGYLTSFATAMLGVWSSIVEFVTGEGNELVLIGLVAWLFVMGTSGVLRLIRGV